MLRSIAFIEITTLLGVACLPLAGCGDGGEAKKNEEKKGGFEINVPGVNVKVKPGDDADRADTVSQ